MRGKMTLEQASSILRSTEPEKAFYVNNGPVLFSLADLNSALQKMSKETFAYHANEEKNDFANWIETTLGDETLAKSIRLELAKTNAKKRIKTRLDQLNRLIK